MAVRVNRYGGGSKRRDEEDAKKKSTAAKQTKPQRNTPSISNVKPITSTPVRTQDQPKRNAPSIADVKPIQSTAKQSQTKGSTVAKATVPLPVKKTDEKKPKVEAPIMKQLKTENKWENPLLSKPPVIPTKPKYTTSDVRDKYDPTEKNAVTKFTVKPVTTNVYDSLVNGTNPPKPTAQNPNPEPVVEMWYLKDGDDMLKVSDYSVGVKEIGRERLVGITENDRVVMYNKITGDIYKFSQPDEEYRNARVLRDTYELKLNNLSRKADMVVADYEAQIKEYEAKLQEYKTRIDNGEQLNDADYAELQKLYEEGAKIEVLRDHALITYNTAMQEALAKYDEARATLSSKGMSMEEWHTYKLLRDKADNPQVPLTREENIALSELHKRVESGATTVYATDDYFNKLAASADTVDTIRSEYEEYMKYFSDYDSDTQVNSVLDVIRRISARTIFDQNLGTTVGEDIASLAQKTLLAPIQYAVKNVKDIVALSGSEWVEKAEAKYANSKLPEKTKNALKALYIMKESGSDAFMPALKSALSILLNNTLVSVGETADITNILKPWLVGSFAYGKDDLENTELRELNERTDAYIQSGEMADSLWYKLFPPSSVDSVAGWEAVKSFWGANGTTPNYEYDILLNEDSGAGVKFLCFVADIVFDPGTWLTGGAKGVLNAADADTITDTMRSVFKQADIVLPATKEVDDLLLEQANWMFKRAIHDKNTALEATLVEAVQRTQKELSIPDGLDKYLKAYGTKNTREQMLDAMTSATEKLIKAAAEESKLLPSRLSTAYDVIQSVRRAESVDKALTKLMFYTSAPVVGATVLTAKALKKALTLGVNERIANRALTSVQRIGDRVDNHFSEPGALAKDMRIMMQEVDDELAHVLTSKDLADADSVKFLQQYKPEVFRALTDSYVSRDLKPFRDIMHSGKATDAILAELDEYVAKNINNYDDFVTWYKDVLANSRTIEHYSPGAAQLLDAFKQEYRSLVATRNISVIEQGLGAYRNNIEFVNYAFRELTQGGEYISLITPAQREVYTNMHNALKGMADSFNLTYAPELAQEYARLADALDNKLKEIGDSANTVFAVGAFKDELDAFLDVATRYTTKIDEYAQNLRFAAYMPVQFNEQAVIRHPDTTALGLDEIAKSIQKVVERMHGVSLDPEVIMSEVFADTLDDIVAKGGTLNLEEISRIYALIPSKLTVVQEYINNDAMAAVVDNVLDVNTQVNAALNTLKDELYEAADRLLRQNMPATAQLEAVDAIDTLLSDFIAQRNTKFFVDELNKELASLGTDEYTRAFLDAYVGASATTINRAYSNMTGLGDVTYTVDKITNNIVEAAAKFINGVDDTQYLKMFDRHCNTVDTEANVELMLDLIKQEKIHTVDGAEMTIKELLDADADKYIDVVYSTDMSIKNADPFMVSFAVDGEVATFRNADATLTAKSNTFELYGTSHANALQQYEQVSKRVQGLSAEDYVTAVDDYFASLYERAAAEGKQVRFVGFNNCAAGTGQERAITKFARDNGLGIHISAQVDVANFLRAEKGIKDIPKEAVAGLSRAVRNTITAASPMNTIHGIAGGLVMDTSVDYADVAERITAAASRSDGVSRVLDPMLNGLVTAYRAVGINNANVGSGSASKLINEYALCDLINRAADSRNKVTRVNCMRMIYDACKGKDFDVNLKTKLNIEYLRNWFDIDTLTTIGAGISASTYLDEASELVRKLDNFHNRISNPELLDEVGMDAYEKLFNMVTYDIAHAKITGDLTHLELIKNLTLDSAQDYHAALMYLKQKYSTTYPSDAYITRTARGFGYNEEFISRMQYAMATTDIQTANDSVYNTTHVARRNRYTKLLNGKYSAATATTNVTHAMDATLDHAFKQLEDVDTFAEYLGARVANAEANGIATSKDYIHHALFQKVVEPYRELVNAIESMVPPKPNKEVMDPVMYATKQFNRNTAMADIQKQLMDVQDIHTREAVKTILALPDDDFVTYVVRNAFNALLIDPNTPALQDVTTNTLLFNKLRHLQSTGKLVVEEIDAVTGELVTAASKGVDRTYIRIYQDLSGMTDEAKDMLFKQYDNASANLYAARANTIRTRHATEELYGSIERAYERYLLAMQEHMPDSYAVSTMETMTQETMQSIQQFFPENARLDLARFNSWFDDGFNCSLLGDRNIHTQFNMYASDNIINNMGMGINHVRNKLEATTNYLAMFDNPTQSLRYMLELTDSTDMSVKDLKKALDSRGHVLTTSTFENGEWTVHELALNTDAELKAYLSNSRVICVPREVMFDLQEYAKGVNKKWKLEHADAFQRGLINMTDAYRSKIRSIRMAGYLFTPFAGPAVRNLIDASIKGHNDIGNRYFTYAKNAMEYYHSYNGIIDYIMEHNSAVTSENIAEYFAKNATPLLDKDTFLKLHGFYSSTAAGIVNFYKISNSKQTSKLLGLLPEGSKVNEEMLQSAQEIFETVYAKHKRDVDKPLAAMRAEAHKALAKLGYDAKTTDELADLFYNFTPSGANWERTVKNTPIIGKALYKYMDANSKMFSAGETISRTAMAMYYMEECGYTVSQANERVIAAQFNYNARGKLLDKVELLMPFSTYKVYNAKYWLTEAPKKYSTMRNIMKYTDLTGAGYDSDELTMIIRNAMIVDKLRSGELVSDEEGNIEEAEGVEAGVFSTMYHTVPEVIDNYKGMPSRYATGLRLGDNHVLKLGNSFVDALDFVYSSLMAPFELANGHIPTILGDNVYSPLATLISGINAYIRNGGSFDGEILRDEQGNVTGYTGFVKWMHDNYYDIIDIVPLYGALANTVITHIKNGNINLPDMVFMNCVPELKKEFVKEMYENVLRLSGTIMPSLVGTIYDSEAALHKPIGYDWYNQTEEYRDTHRYVFGLSYFGSYLSKDPATYVDYTGKLKKLGYSDEEVSMMLEFMYGGTEKPGMYAYDPALVEYTLNTLVDKGYTVEEAIELIMSGTQWVDPLTGEVRDDAEVMSTMLNSAFLARYDLLPDYIKYDKNQYSMLKEYYKNKGYTTEQAWLLMSAANGYIDEQGRYRELTPEQAAAYNKQINDDYLEFMDGLPDWYKYEPGAATRTVNALIAQGMTLQQARAYILQNNYYVDVDGVAYHFTPEESLLKTAQSQKEFNDYYSQLPDYLKYEKGAYSRTLNYLKQIGYDTDTAKEFIKNGAYYTVDGRLINCTELERKRTEFKTLSDEEFTAYYSELPEYLRYEKGAFSRTYAYLKEQGYTYYEILELIKNGAYLTDTGELIDCRGMKRPPRGSYYSNKNYNDYKKYYRPKAVKAPYIRKSYMRKPYVMSRNRSSTYSKVNALAGASYGYRKVYKVDVRANAARKALSTKSDYPAAYRNIVYAHRRNLYKELYAKYGTSRIIMRSNAYKTYSNACITRLRRNEIYNRVKYGNRRSSF